MGGSYKQCGGCGKRALSIATRCPACGGDLLGPAAPEPGLDRNRLLRVGIAGGVLAAAVLAVATLGRISDTPHPRAAPVAVDTMASSESGYATGAATRLDTTSSAALPARSVGKLFVTRTWTNVRQSRSTRADRESLLLPGDTVVADSLQRGWYRVTMEGEVIGYVHRSTLTAPPPGAVSASTGRPESR